MKLSLHWKNLTPSEALREHVERRLSFGLGRFVPKVLEVRVVLADANGDRGGLDKHCRVQARTHSGLVQVEEQDHDLYVAVDLAVDRLQRTLARTLGRTHFQHTGRWRAERLHRRRHFAARTAGGLA